MVLAILAWTGVVATRFELAHPAGCLHYLEPLTVAATATTVATIACSRWKRGQQNPGYGEPAAAGQQQGGAVAGLTGTGLTGVQAMHSACREAQAGNACILPQQPKGTAKHARHAEQAQHAWQARGLTKRAAAQLAAGTTRNSACREIKGT